MLRAQKNPPLGRIQSPPLVAALTLRVAGQGLVGPGWHFGGSWAAVRAGASLGLIRLTQVLVALHRFQFGFLLSRLLLSVSSSGNRPGLQQPSPEVVYKMLSVSFAWKNALLRLRPRNMALDVGRLTGP